MSKWCVFFGVFLSFGCDRTDSESKPPRKPSSLGVEVTKNAPKGRGEERCEDASGFRTVGVSYDTICALSVAGEIYCRSDRPAMGSCSRNSRSSSDFYKVDTGGEAVEQVAVGHGFSCAVTVSGRVGCWGENQVGVLGREKKLTQRDDDSCFELIELGSRFEATYVAVGDLHACALAKDGRVKCWGSNELGVLGLGYRVILGNSAGQMGDHLPYVDLGGEKVGALALGKAHSCALTLAGHVYCWGSNSLGELGNNDRENRGDDPAEMGDQLQRVPGVVARQISASGQRTCALRDDGSATCWGDSFRVSKSGRRPWSYPASGASRVETGGGLVCQVDGKKLARCWGGGRSGDSTIAGQESALLAKLTPDSRVEEVKHLALGSRQSCLVDGDGEVVCWPSDKYPGGFTSKADVLRLALCGGEVKQSKNPE